MYTTFTKAPSRFVINHYYLHYYLTTVESVIVRPLAFPVDFYAYIL